MTQYLEERMVEGSPAMVGRDPRQMSVAELNELGHEKTALRKLIRRNCVSCSGDSQAEVKNCVIVDCVFWPYRMNKNPFSERKGNPDAIAALAKAREAKAALSKASPTHSLKEG